MRPIPDIRGAVRERSSLIHCITNPISINQCANAILAVGGRPIMAEHPREVSEITATAGALMLNLGNITDVRMAAMRLSARTAAEHGTPILLDAVGVACSRLRRDYACCLMEAVTPAVIKGNYSEINALLAGTADAEIKAKYADVIDQLPAMKELYGHRARLRKERGCMDIESGEVKLILDENGRCIDVKKRTSGESESMIEEFMLLANQCAAHFARVKQIPFVYRVHEEPNAEKLERLHALLQACGINDHFAKEVPTPKELSAILEGVRGTPYEQIINTGMLRCMSKAVYEEKPKGHYGLVLKDYAHFTSPIRRYPDLAIHRIMTDLLQGTDKETMILRYTDFAERASKQSSEREVIAMQIERKAEDCYKAEYARRHLGECYEGTISGVTQRGLFIELDNGVEGFVPASSLTPSGTSLTEGVRLTDPASGKTWSLGDKMMITIVRADVNLGKIDFEVAPAAKA